MIEKDFSNPYANMIVDYTLGIADIELRINHLREKRNSLLSKRIKELEVECWDMMYSLSRLREYLKDDL